MRIIEQLCKAIRQAAVFNLEIQVAPACILWPDRDRQWETVIPQLQTELPELLILGEYSPEKRTGPAIWLRCVLAEKMDLTLAGERPLIFYLPGVSRQDLRVVESCPEHLKPLVELQYRGVIWSRVNAKDWTIMAFLKSDQGGLALDVAQDNETKNAMQLALYRLLDENIDLLKGKRLDKDYFNTLLSGGDPIRDLLQWLDQGDSFRAARGENEWQAFIEVCKSQLAFNPQNEGALVGAAKLATLTGPWRAAWERFCEAPKRYPNIPCQIRKCKPPADSLLWSAGGANYEGWPQWNEDQEKNLRQYLKSLNGLPPHLARQRIAELEKLHGERRQLVWAELGESPLAMALRYLAELAEITSHNLASGTIEDLVTGYRNWGWQADRALTQALACVENQDNLEAITGAIRSIYLPWAEDSARYLQKLIESSEYPGGNVTAVKPDSWDNGECILFVDGLRFDSGKRLAELLASRGLEIMEKTVWAALPSVTATGKPAVSPVKDKITGREANTDYEPSLAETGQSLKGGYHFKKLFEDAGWTVLERNDNGDGHGKAWCEFGDIDHEGHERGWKLAKYLEASLMEIGERIIGLLGAGWRKVHVVTDHGWLLAPGGLPKTTLSSALVESKWGRCAALKPGVSTDERLYPWFWNPSHHFALADGISCFISNEEYAHGGLSLQECLTPRLTVSLGQNTQPIAVEISDIVWKGLRCTVVVESDSSGLLLDIRTQPGNPSSSVVLSLKPFKEDGTASVIVEADELEGKKATIVLLHENGELISQADTIIGGGKND